MGGQAVSPDSSGLEGQILEAGGAGTSDLGFVSVDEPGSQGMAGRVREPKRWWLGVGPSEGSGPASPTMTRRASSSVGRALPFIEKSTVWDSTLRKSQVVEGAGELSWPHIRVEPRGRSRDAQEVQVAIYPERAV